MSDLTAMIAKNVARHSVKFYEKFSISQRTWDAHSYFWTGEILGEMLVMVTKKKNTLYQSEVEAGIVIDFEGEDYILQ